MRQGLMDVGSLRLLQPAKEVEEQSSTRGAFQEHEA